MHIPDGFLDSKTWISLSIISAGMLGGILNKIKRMEIASLVPLIGMISAFVFAAQMLNFPVAGGTSGHFMGGVFCSVILGPLTGFLSMSLVLIVQCLLFQDGGLTALGANIFNMAFIGSVVGFYLYGFFRFLIKGKKARPIAYALSSWMAVMLAATFTALELAISGTIRLSIVLPAMLAAHTVIGIGEALITAFALVALERIMPEIMKARGL